MHKAVKEKLVSHKYLSALGALLLLSVVLVPLSMFFAQGSVFGYNGVAYEYCLWNEEGDIVNSCGNIREDLPGDFQEFSAESDNNFNARIKWAGADNGQDLKEPVVPYLWKNGYRTEQNEDWSDVQLGDDVEFTPEVREALSRGSTCRLNVEIWSDDFHLYHQYQGEIIEQSYEEDYNEVWGDFEGDVVNRENYYVSQDERYKYYPRDARKAFSEVTVRTDAVSITDSGDIDCTFSLTEIVEKGSEMPGDFYKFEGHEPQVNEDGASSSIYVDLAMDSDGDGVVDSEDECPETSGLEEKNGCPNEASKILSVDGPRNVTVGEEVSYSATVQNPDDDSTEISWSNGDTGSTASYSWNSTGNKTVSVSTDDGFTTETEEIRISVEEKSLLKDIFEFFGGLWQALTFQG